MFLTSDQLVTIYHSDKKSRDNNTEIPKSCLMDVAGRITILMCN